MSVKISEMAVEELRSRAKGLSDEELEIFLSEIPFETLWAHTSGRVFKMQKKLVDIKHSLNKIYGTGDMNESSNFVTHICLKGGDQE